MSKIEKLCSMDIENKIKENKNKFVSVFLSELKEHKWDSELFTKVNSKCDFTPDYHLVLFENKSDFIKFIEYYLDCQMIEHIKNSAQNENKNSIREIIANCLKFRIINNLDKAVALKISAQHLMPNNTGISIASAARTCDIIWKLAGDKSTDFNYYSKRSLLLTVYISAKTYYFADESEEYNQTKLFINNSLNNIVNVGSRLKKILKPKLEDIPILRLFS